MNCAEGTQVVKKRMKLSAEENESDEKTRQADLELVEAEETEAVTNSAASEEMRHHIGRIHQKIENFTELVSELLESGKVLLKQLSDEFEERMITIHKEQMQKWHEEIKELHMLDTSNEEANVLLYNARDLLNNVHEA